MPSDAPKVAFTLNTQKMAVGRNNLLHPRPQCCSRHLVSNAARIAGFDPELHPSGQASQGERRADRELLVTIRFNSGSSARSKRYHT